MVSVQEIMDIMEELAPRSYAEDWDNPGLLVGSPAQETVRIAVCLDVSDAVVQMAIEHDAHLIISHHPMIFRAMKSFRTDTPLGSRIAELVKHDIAVFAAHTNLDIAQGGVNDVLAETIGLEGLAHFVVQGQDEAGGTYSLGRVGELQEAMTIAAFAAQVREALKASHVRYVSAGARPVQRVALCPGSGAEFIEQAARLGADAYLTGDVRYHDAQHAVELGLHVVDAGHFGTEFPVVERLRARLAEALAERGLTADVIADKQSEDFFHVI